MHSTHGIRRSFAAVALVALVLGGVGLGLNIEHSPTNSPITKSTTLIPAGTPQHPVVVKLDPRTGQVISIVGAGVVELSPTTGRIIQKAG